MNKTSVSPEGPFNGAAFIPGVIKRTTS